MGLQFGVTKKLINSVHSKSNSFTAMKMKTTLFYSYSILLIIIPTSSVVRTISGLVSKCCKEQKKLDVVRLKPNPNFYR